MYHQLEEIKLQIAARNLHTVKSEQVASEYEDFSNDLTWLFSNPDTFDANNFNRFDTEIILTYLRKTHHYYTSKCLDEIAQTIDQLKYKSDTERYWKPILLKAFNNYSSELCKHIDEEEQELFPYIDSLIEAQRSSELHISFDRKVKLINHLLNHTDEAEHKLRSLITLLKERVDQFEDTLALNILLAKLRSFERDLVVHAKIEDDVLLPKALKLEKAVLSNTKISLD